MSHLKRYLLGFLFAAACLANPGSSFAQAAPCVGGPLTITKPTATSLLIDGTACNDIVKLDTILPKYPGVTDVEVKLRDGNDDFFTPGYPGIKLIVHGGLGDDHIVAKGTFPSAFIKVDLFGEDGNDSIVMEDNNGKSVGGNGTDNISSGDGTAGVGTQKLFSGTLAAPSDGSIDNLSCFDGPVSSVSFDSGEGDGAAGC